MTLLSPISNHKVLMNRSVQHGYRSLAKADLFKMQAGPRKQFSVDDKETVSPNLEVNRLPIVHHHQYVCDLPARHRFAMRKFHKVFRNLKSDNVISMKQVFEPNLVSKPSLVGVHDADYVDRFYAGHTSEKEQKISGFKWTPGILTRCRYETGGTVLASVLALKYGLACSTGGGTHHAFPSYGSGYCLINDLAVSADYCITKKLAERVLVVDLDVHQGDGTAFIFRNHDDVFTFSMHCEKNFPFTKQDSDLDIGLDIGTEDMEYMQKLAEVLPHLLDTFRPQLVLYDAGIDPHVDDDLGKLNLTDQGLFQRDYYVMRTVLNKGCACAAVIGGGYSKDLNELGRRHSIVHRAATRVWDQLLSPKVVAGKSWS